MQLTLQRNPSLFRPGYPVSGPAAEESCTIPTTGSIDEDNLSSGQTNLNVKQWAPLAGAAVGAALGLGAAKLTGAASVIFGISAGFAALTVTGALGLVAGGLLSLPALGAGLPDLARFVVNGFTLAGMVGGPIAGALAAGPSTKPWG